MGGATPTGIQVYWGGRLSRIHDIRAQGSFEEAPPTSLQIRKLRHERGADASTSAINSWFPVNISWFPAQGHAAKERQFLVAARYRAGRIAPHRPSQPIKTEFLALSSLNVHGRCGVNPAI